MRVVGVDSSLGSPFEGSHITLKGEAGPVLLKSNRYKNHRHYVRVSERISATSLSYPNAIIRCACLWPPGVPIEAEVSYTSVWHLPSTAFTTPTVIRQMRHASPNITMAHTLNLSGRRGFLMAGNAKEVPTEHRGTENSQLQTSTTLHPCLLLPEVPPPIPPARLLPEFACQR